jgi:hypothetical protein
MQKQSDQIGVQGKQTCTALQDHQLLKVNPADRQKETGALANYYDCMELSRDIHDILFQLRVK